MLDFIEVKLLTPAAKVPTRAHDSDAGLDLYWDGHAAVSFTPPGSFAPVKFHTGVAINIPRGYVGIVKARSGLSVKTGYNVLAGVIDAGYTGEIVVVVDRLINVTEGDKIAQLLIVPIALPKLVVVDEFTESSARGTNGFGSTDNPRLELPLEDGFRG